MVLGKAYEVCTRSIAATRASLKIRRSPSLSTAIREFSALKGMPYYEPDILDAILEAKPRDLPEVTDVTAQKAMDRYNVNEPQARAIIGAMRVEGFALIQG